MSSKNTKDKSSEKDWFDSRVEVIGLTPERNKQINNQISFLQTETDILYYNLTCKST